MSQRVESEERWERQCQVEEAKTCRGDRGQRKRFRELAQGAHGRGLGEAGRDQRKPVLSDKTTEFRPKGRLACIQARVMSGLTRGVGGREMDESKIVRNKLEEPNEGLDTESEGKLPGRTPGFWFGQPGDRGAVRSDSQLCSSPPPTLDPHFKGQM